MVEQEEDIRLQRGPFHYHGTQSEMGYDGWLSKRRGLLNMGYYGASEVAAILGRNPYQSPVEVWRVKTGREAPFAGSRDTERGQIMEDVIITMANKWLGWEVIPYGRLLASNQYPLSCTPDAYMIDGDGKLVTVQIKDTRQSWEEPPLQYQIQVQTELMVTGWDAGYVLWYDGNKQLDYFRVEIDPVIQELILNGVQRFGAYVQDDQEPPIPPTPEMNTYLKKQERDDEECVNLPDEAASWDARLQEIKKESAALEREKKRLESKILSAMGTASTGRIPGGARYSVTHVSIPDGVRKGYEYKRLNRSKR